MNITLTTPANTRRRFANRMIAALRQAGETSPIHYDADKFELWIDDDRSPFREMPLGNPLHECSTLPPDEQGKVLESYARALFAVRSRPLFPAEFEQARDCLIPHVHARSDYEYVLSAPSRTRKADTFWYKPIGDHLATGIAYDLPGGIVEVGNSVLAKWGITGEEAFDIACRNLRRKSDQPFDSPERGVFVSKCDDGYGVSRLALTELIRDLEVQGNHVAIAPNRDTLIVTGSDDPAGLRVMLKLAEEAFYHSHRVSGISLRFREGQWEPFEPDACYPDLEGYRTLRLQSLWSAYKEQKKAIESSRADSEEDVFIPSYFLITTSLTEPPTSYATWTKGLTSLLPQTEKVCFIQGASAQGNTIGAFADWARVQDVVGDLMKPVGLYPQRFRVEQFPTGEQLKAIGFAPEFEGLGSTSCSDGDKE